MPVEKPDTKPSIQKETNNKSFFTQMTGMWKKAKKTGENLVFFKVFGLA